MEKIKTAYHFSDKEFVALRPGTDHIGWFGSGIYLGLESQKLIDFYLKPSSKRRALQNRQLISINNSNFTDMAVYKEQLAEQLGIQTPLQHYYIDTLITNISLTGPKSPQQIERYCQTHLSLSALSPIIIQTFANQSLSIRTETYYPEIRLYEVDIHQDAKIIDTEQTLKEQGITQLTQEQICALLHLKNPDKQTSDFLFKEATGEFILRACRTRVEELNISDNEKAQIKESQKKLFQYYQKTIYNNPNEIIKPDCLNSQTDTQPKSKELYQQQLKHLKEQLKHEKMFQLASEILLQKALHSLILKYFADIDDRSYLDVLQADGFLFDDAYTKSHCLLIKNPDVLTLKSYQIIIKDNQMIGLSAPRHPIKPIPIVSQNDLKNRLNTPSHNAEKEHL